MNWHIWLQYLPWLFWPIFNRCFSPFIEYSKGKGSPLPNIHLHTCSMQVCKYVLAPPISYEYVFNVALVDFGKLGIPRWIFPPCLQSISNCLAPLHPSKSILGQRCCLCSVTAADIFVFLSVCSTCETFLTDKKHVLCYPHSWVYWELPNIRDPLETSHMATPAAVVAGTKVFFILLSPPPMGSPDGPRSQTGNLAVFPPGEPCRPQLPSVSIGNFHLWKTGCFKPWSALQMLKCHNKTLQVVDLDSGNLPRWPSLIGLVPQTFEFLNLLQS